MVGVYSGFKIHSTFGKFERDIILFLFQWQPEMTKEIVLLTINNTFLFLKDPSSIFSSSI